MHVAVNEFSRSLLNQEHLSDVPVEELRQLVARYPFFVAGRMLYLKKLYAEGSPLLDEELGKADIWIPNTAWLDHLVFDTGNGSVADTNNHQTSGAPAYVSETHYAADTETVQESDVPYDTLTGLSSVVEEEAEAPVDTAEENAADDEIAFHDAVENADNPVVADEAEPAVYSAFDEMNRYGTGSSEDAIEDQTLSPGAETDFKDPADPSHSEPLPEEVPAPSNSEDALTPVPGPEEEAADEPEIIVDDEEENHDEIIHNNESSPDDTLSANYDNSNGATDEDENQVEEGQEQVGEVEFRIAPYREEPLSENAELNFEPLHTVDYFASQGIQAKEEDKPADRFTQQLKSFTQWLKAMKKIPAAAPGEAIREEKRIEEMAEHSIHGKDVWTEAMAEVWLKQGNLQKARLVYEKLSLLDPSKSTYFAAKIEQLKHL